MRESRGEGRDRGRNKGKGREGARVVRGIVGNGKEEDEREGRRGQGKL